MGFLMKARNLGFFTVAIITVSSISGICFASDDGDFQYWSIADVSFDINKDWNIENEVSFIYNTAFNQHWLRRRIGKTMKSFADGKKK